MKPFTRGLFSKKIAKGQTQPELRNRVFLGNTRALGLNTDKKPSFSTLVRLSYAILSCSLTGVMSFDLALSASASSEWVEQNTGRTQLSQNQPVTPLSAVVEEIEGIVTYGPSQTPVSQGQRLGAGESQLLTGNNSSVRLHIPQLGSVEVSENTALRIKTLSTGRTSLFVSKGQVRLSVGTGVLNQGQQKVGASSAISMQETNISGNRPLESGQKLLLAQQNANGNYPVDIETPAGVAGVQGTSFGVNVGPDGKTGVSSIQGNVDAIAQGRRVPVRSGQYVVIPPGQAPISPQTIPPRAKLKVLSVRRVGAKAIRVMGKIDPLDILFINGQAIQTDAEGNFMAIVERPLNRRLRFVVRGPEVRETAYEIAVL